MTPAGRRALWAAAALLLLVVAAAGEGMKEGDFSSAGPDQRLELLINLNTAGTASLESLPGIGPVLASRIIDHRRLVGPFRRIDGLLQVPGIGPVRIEALTPYLTVGRGEKFSGTGE